MKKRAGYASYILAVGVFTAVLLSCSGSYILSSIENEVKLKKATTQGTIRDIVKLGSALYCSNGSVLTKSAFNQGDWTVVASPVEGLCSGLAADTSGKLFASFTGYYDDFHGVYVYDNGSWANVSGTDAIQCVKGSGTVFGSDDSKTYPITASGIGAAINGTIIAAGGNYVATTEGLFDGSGTQVSGVSGVFAIDNSGTYALTGTELFKIAAPAQKFTHGISSPSDAVVVSVASVEHLLVSAQSNGYREIIVDSSDLTQSKTISHGSSEALVAASVSAQYESSVGKYPCGCILADSNASGFYIYVGINDPHFAKYTGLWGFYSSGKQEWNRE